MQEHAKRTPVTNGIYKLLCYYLALTLVVLVEFQARSNFLEVGFVILCFLGACFCAVKLIYNNQSFGCLYTVLVFFQQCPTQKVCFYPVDDSKGPFQMILLLKVVCRQANNDVVTKHLATLHPRILQWEYTEGRSDQVVICFPYCLC